jgi:hypothetical protein
MWDTEQGHDNAFKKVTAPTDVAVVSATQGFRPGPAARPQDPTSAHRKEPPLGHHRRETSRILRQRGKRHRQPVHHQRAGRRRSRPPTRRHDPVPPSTPRRCPTTAAGRHPRQELTTPHRQLRFPAEAAMSQGASAPQPSAPLLPASPRCQAAAAARRGHATRRCRLSTAGPPGRACQGPRPPQQGQASGPESSHRSVAVEPSHRWRSATPRGRAPSPIRPRRQEMRTRTPPGRRPPAAGHARALPGSGPWRRRGSGGKDGRRPLAAAAAAPRVA